MIIAIGGPSNSGKSRLALEMIHAIGPERSVAVCLDDFVFPENQLPRIKDHVDWETPDTIDYSKFQRELLDASRTNEYVIAEGFLIYANKELIPLFDKMIFINLEQKTFKKRKAKDLRWGKEPEWYIDHIWRSYLDYGKPPANLKVLLLRGEEEWSMPRILNFLNN